MKKDDVTAMVNMDDFSRYDSAAHSNVISTTDFRQRLILVYGTDLLVNIEMVHGNLKRRSGRDKRIRKKNGNLPTLTGLWVDHDKL